MRLGKQSDSRYLFLAGFLSGFIAGLVIGFLIARNPPAIIRNLLTISSESYSTYAPMIMSDTIPILGVQIDGQYPVENLVVPNRVYHTMIRWTEVESVKGSYIYPLWLDQMVEWFEPNPVIIDVKTVPEWARLWSEYQGSPPLEEHYDDYGYFVASVCSRYDLWGVELFNEPDMGTQGGDSQDPRGVSNELQYYYGAWTDGTDFYSAGFRYGQMTKVVYPIVKAYCPDTKIIAGAIAGADNGMTFLQGAVDGGLQTDYVSFHYYIFSLDEVSRPFEYAQRVKELGTWPIAITETSYLQDIWDEDLDSLKTQYMIYLRDTISSSSVSFVLWYGMCTNWRNSWMAKDCVPGEAYNKWAEPLPSSGE